MKRLNTLIDKERTGIAMEELEKRWKEILQIVKEEMDLTDIKFISPE